jgi:ferrous iron transport protein A
MNISIGDINIGDEVEIIGYTSSDPKYRSRLLTMGLTRGTTIKLTKCAPMGDPVELEVRGYKLSLRKFEADILKLRSI